MKKYVSNWREIALHIKHRDKWQCQDCDLEFHRGQTRLLLDNGTIVHLTVHHIDADTMNNTDSNLISLCFPCHGRRDLALMRLQHRRKCRENQLILFTEEDYS